MPETDVKVTGNTDDYNKALGTATARQQEWTASMAAGQKQLTALANEARLSKASLEGVGKAAQTTKIGGQAMLSVAADAKTVQAGVTQVGVASQSTAKGLLEMANKAKFGITQVSAMFGAAGLAAGAVMGLAFAAYEYATASGKAAKAAKEAADETLRLIEVEKFRVMNEELAAENEKMWAKERKAAEERIRIEERKVETTQTHAAALGTTKALQEQILNEQINVIKARIAETIHTGENTVELEHQLELLRLQKSLLGAAPTKKSGGGGARSSFDAGDAEQRLAEFRLQAAAKIQQMENDSARSAMGRVAATERQLDLELRLVEARRRFVEAMPERTAEQRADKEMALAEIELEAEEQRREAIVTTRALEAEAFAARIDQIDREIARNESLGVDLGLLEEQRRRMAEEQIVRFGQAEELEAFKFEDETRRLREEQEAEVAAREEELRRFDEDTAMREAEGRNVTNLADRRFELEIRQAKAEKDHDKVRDLQHKREVARVRAEVAAKQRAVDQTGQFMQAGGALGSAIVDAAVKDDEKRQRSQLRMQGMMAVGLALLEGARAAVSFASFNYVEGAMHLVAVGVAAATAVKLFREAENVGSSSGGGSSASVGGGKSTGSQGGQRDPAQAPMSSDELDDARGRGPKKGKGEDKDGGGTTVHINNGIQIGNDSSYLLDTADTKKKKGWG